jgi:GDP-D-mannose dehydratase
MIAPSISFSSFQLNLFRGSLISGITDPGGSLRVLNLTGKTRVSRASTFGLSAKVREIRSAGAVAGLSVLWITVHYCEASSIHASNGILFTDECLSAKRN